MFSWCDEGHFVIAIPYVVSWRNCMAWLWSFLGISIFNMYIHVCLRSCTVIFLVARRKTVLISTQTGWHRCLLLMFGIKVILSQYIWCSVSVTDYDVVNEHLIDSTIKPTVHYDAMGGSMMDSINVRFYDNRTVELIDRRGKPPALDVIREHVLNCFLETGPPGGTVNVFTV